MRKVVMHRGDPRVNISLRGLLEDVSDITSEVVKVLPSYMFLNSHVIVIPFLIKYRRGGTTDECRHKRTKMKRSKDKRLLERGGDATWWSTSQYFPEGSVGGRLRYSEMVNISLSYMFINSHVIVTHSLFERNGVQVFTGGHSPHEWERWCNTVVIYVWNIPWEI